jgi:pimeloyl-ACP methyl ester carboxylesterase
MKPGLKILFLSLLLSSLAFILSPSSFAQTLPLWDRQRIKDEISNDSSGYVTRISKVSDPVIEVFEPYGGNTTGVGVVVCPGGAYQILAINLEGYEIASWLNSLGITAFVLHYTVPGDPASALRDAQRAIRIVKQQYSVRQPFLNKIGIMGFSAGGSLSARLSTRYMEELYPPADAADRFSARPDFTLLIYPAYLDQGPGKTLTPELTIDQATPPMFIFETADDPYGNSALVMAAALRAKKVPVELHYLPFGGHGYGLRPGNPAADAWPDLAARWIKQFITPEDPSRPFNNSRFLEIDGISLHYRIWPAASASDSVPGILLVHGMGGSTWSWEQNAPVLAEAGYKVIAVDIPPFGFSDKNLNVTYVTRNRAEYLWKFLDAIDPGKKWDLMGHSMGGGIVQAMGILHPEKTRRVVFVDPALFIDQEMKGPRNTSILRFKPLEILAAGIGKATLISPGGVRKFLTSAFGQEPDSADVAEYYRALALPGTARGMIRAGTRSYDPQALSGRNFASQALAIWGEKDTWVPLEPMKPILKILPTVTLTVIEGAGHCPMTTHSDLFNEKVIDYLKTKDY